MQSTPQGSDRGMSVGRVALASAIGTTIEWYDFFLYGVVTPIVLNKLFFPNYDPIAGTLLAYTTFFVGFLSRPIGGIIFGHYGDRIGRKTVLVLTLLIMGLATFLIGLLPTYADVGIWAPVLLLVLRVFQGIGIGGEWGGAVLMAVEHSPEGRRGFYGSWPQIGVPAGLLLSSGMVYLLSFLPESDFFSWGWRISFLISAVLVGIGLYIRLKIMETPVFVSLQRAQRIVHVPFFELISTHGWNTLLGLGARYIEGVTFNIFGVFVIAYHWSVAAAPADGPRRRHDFVRAHDRDAPDLWQSVRPHRAAAHVRLCGTADWHLVVSGVLADGDKNPHPDLVGDHGAVRLRVPCGLRAAGRPVLGIVRHARALHRNFVRLSVLGNLRERPDADHRHVSAAGRRQQAVADLRLYPDCQHH
jgi:MFS family permease